MIVHDFDVDRTLVPPEAKTPLVVDPDAVLSFAAAPECLQPIARDRAQVTQTRGGIQHVEFSQGDPSDRLKPADAAPVEEGLSLTAPKAPDHVPIILRET
jgi:hypothetical protein